MNSYYDNLASYYKYIYPDWDKSILRQANALDSVIREFIEPDRTSILDVACGIGTQSIGLAKIGYQVEASDLSPGEIAVARKEAARHKVKINFQVANMLQAWETHQHQFDVVIACDNSIPHLLSEVEILQAFSEFYKCTRDGGCCIISVRDYSNFEIDADKKQMYPRQIHTTGSGQVLMFDVWSFKGSYYEMTTYVIEENIDGRAQTLICRGGTYFLVQIPTLERLFTKAGFREVHTLRDRFFQPLLIAIK